MLKEAIESTRTGMFIRSRTGIFKCADLTIGQGSNYYVHFESTRTWIYSFLLTVPLPKEAMIMFIESTRTGIYSFLQTFPLPKEAILMFIESTRTGKYSFCRPYIA